MPAEFDIVFATDLESFLLSVSIPSISCLTDLQDERTSKEDLIRVARAYRLVALLEIYAIYPSLLAY